MKSVLACVGAAGLLVLVGPLTQSSQRLPQPAVVPAWLNLPEEGQLVSVEYSGSFGGELSAGTVTYELGDDAGRQLSAMKARLAANGFIIEEQLTSVDGFMGASNLALAYQPASGRVLNMMQLDTPAGEMLRVTFRAPPSPALAEAR